MLPLVERLADALEWFIRLSLPAATEREISVSYADVLEPGRALPQAILADELLALPSAAARPATPPASPATIIAHPAPPAAAPAAEPPPEGAAPRAPVHAPAPLAPAIFGPYRERIGRNLQREGARVFLVGPTATGKTFQAIQAAIQLGWQIETVVLDPGKDAQELVGGFTRSPRPAAPSLGLE